MIAPLHLKNTLYAWLLLLHSKIIYCFKYYCNVLLTTYNVKLHMFEMGDHFVILNNRLEDTQEIPSHEKYSH